MTTDTRKYANGTSVTQSFPWGMFTSARAECSDGKVRTVSRIAPTADTFFSVPASVTVCKGGERYTVSGYITLGAVSGSSVATDDDPEIVRFIAYSYGKNGHLLPGLRPAAQHAAEV